MRRSESSVGFHGVSSKTGLVGADSKVLTKDWLSPALDASMFIERRRLRRAWLNRRATSALICWRAESSTPDFYRRRGLTLHIIKMISGGMSASVEFQVMGTSVRLGCKSNCLISGQALGQRTQVAVKHASDSAHFFQRKISFTTLYPAHITAINFRLESKALLRKPLGLAGRADSFPKQLERRVFFQHLTVLTYEDLSSTDYSPHFMLAPKPKICQTTRSKNETANGIFHFANPACPFRRRRSWPSLESPQRPDTTGRDGRWQRRIRENQTLLVQATRKTRTGDGGNQAGNTAEDSRSDGTGTIARGANEKSSGDK